MSTFPSHHLIHGICQDYLTGKNLEDTDDERYRQKIARFLVEEKGYAKDELEPRLKIETLFCGQFVVSSIDLVARLAGRHFLLLRYGPGSLVTRERPAIAAARILNNSHQIPLAVVTNGEDAELLDTYTGKVMATGLAGIPSRDAALAMLPALRFDSFSDDARRERELRILNAFDVEICCVGGPCALPGVREGR